MIVDTHVHVFTDDRKKYPQIRDTERAGALPTIRDIGQTDWTLTTAETLAIAAPKLAGICVALVWNYVLYSRLVFRPVEEPAKEPVHD